MRTYSEQKGKESRSIAPNKSAVQRVHTVAIETIARGNHRPRIVFNSANASHLKKQGIENRRANNPGGVGRFKLIDRTSSDGVLTNAYGTGNQLGVDELLMIVSHGGRPTNYNPNNKFAGKSPDDLAQELFNSGIFPLAYKGQIYLNGCSTGVPLNSLRDNTSFAERFKNSLRNIKNNNLGPFTVKGNLGTASIEQTHYANQAGGDIYGTDWMKLGGSSERLIIDNLVSPLFSDNKVRKADEDNNNGRLFKRQNTYMRGSLTKAVY